MSSSTQTFSEPMETVNHFYIKLNLSSKIHVLRKAENRYTLIP